ncbi:dienelactone hydrolase family protein [Xylariomycetidae sp. FL2044]|nr:dienelactone hydrolase family protein [Xylariomycetidae sp. FL2044]
MALQTCCLKSFQWDGEPTGRVGKLAANDAYITGDNPDAAVLLVHDALGWTFPNARLLADHYAREAGVTVYLPDFFGGDVLPFDLLLAGRFDLIDMKTFMSKNGREAREPEIFACARALRETYAKVGAIGFCYGGWAVARLGAREHADRPLVDCVSMGHPSLLTEKDVDELAVPVQVLAPEHDAMYSPAMKKYTLETLLRLNIAFDYQHLPGVEHGCLSRGDAKVPGERDAMARAKNAAVAWFVQFLK